MKRIGLSVAGLVVMLAVGMAHGQVATLEQTLHNFAGQGFAGGEVCKPCHTPHNAVSADISTRLWAHTLTSANYKIRHGDQISTHQASEVLDRASRMCMGCHDGTIAKADYVNAPAGYQSDYMSARYLMGTTAAGSSTVDLTNQHPVGETGLYPNVSVYAAEHPKKNYYKAAVLGQGWEVAVPGTTVKLPLESMATQSGNTVYANGQVVSCVTCHAAHGAPSGQVFNGVARPVDSLLRVTNTGSRMCLACHNK